MSFDYSVANGLYGEALIDYIEDERFPEEKFRGRMYTSAYKLGIYRAILRQRTEQEKGIHFDLIKANAQLDKLADYVEFLYDLDDSKALVGVGYEGLRKRLKAFITELDIYEGLEEDDDAAG